MSENKKIPPLHVDLAFSADSFAAGIRDALSEGRKLERACRKRQARRRIELERRVLGLLIIMESLALAVCVDPAWTILGVLTIPIGLTLAMFPFGDGCPPGAWMQ